MWDSARQFELTYPHLKNKIIFSGHGPVDFVKMKFNKYGNIPITESDIDKFDVDADLIQWLKERILGFSVVSHQLQDKLITCGLDQDSTVCITQCGADEEIFYPKKSIDIQSTDLIKIIYPYSNITFTSYDPKRISLFRRIQQKVLENNLLIEFVLPTEHLPLDKVPDFYRQGDIFLCISHSEGNPLGAFEAGACGLTVITTNVGEMSKFIIDGTNGFIIDNTDSEKIFVEVIDRLKKLCTDRELLATMKQNMLQHVLDNWTWKHKINQWDNFFAKCIDQKNMDSEINNFVNNYCGNIVPDTKSHVKNLVVITSKIIVSNNKFTYTDIRSIYSTEERFEQTKNTIASIKQYIPDAFIILFDNSDFNEYPHIVDYMNTNSDVFLNSSGGKILFENTNRSPFKQVGELAQTKYIIGYINKIGITFDHYFKISGRYVINDDFDYSAFDNQSNVFNKITGMSHNYYTSFYKIHSSKFSTYAQTIDDVYDQCHINKKFAESALEEVLPLKLKYDFVSVGKLGITQNIAVCTDIKRI